jgi:hypothetical protein
VTRDQALAESIRAAARAKEFAQAADRDLNHPDLKHETPRLTAVGAVWADVSRSYSALAAALPETTTEV